MNEIRVWVDGQLEGADVPSVRALDHGVTVGDGAFETCKVADGEVFAMTRHLRRIDRTLAGLGLPPIDQDRIREGAAAVLAAGPEIGFGRLRWTVTGGAGPLGSDRDDSPMTYIVTAAEMPRPTPTAAISTVPWTRNERSATAGLKTTSYAENVIALAHAKERGGQEAIFANTRGELCEATGSNIFVVVDGVLSTPPLDSGCLAGITRELVVEWCREAGVEVREEALPLSVLEIADEVFITSSARDVHAVHDVDGRALAAPGPVSTQVAQVWADALTTKGIDP